MNWIDDVMGAIDFEDKGDGKQLSGFDARLLIYCQLQFFISGYDLFTTDRDQWKRNMTPILLKIANDLNHTIAPNAKLIDDLLHCKSIEQIHSDAIKPFKDARIAGAVLFNLWRMKNSGFVQSVNKSIYLVSTLSNISDRKVFSCWSKYKSISHLYIPEITLDHDALIGISQSVEKETFIDVVDNYIKCALYNITYFFIFGIRKTNNQSYIDKNSAWMFRPKTVIAALRTPNKMTTDVLNSETEESVIECLMAENKFQPRFSYDYRLDDNELSLLDKYRAPKRL